MALSGMQIYKLLPKTNCKDCGSPNCLTFAMKVSAGKGDFSECPHITPENRTILEEMTEPLIRKLEIKRGDKTLVIGDEKVLFRHEESFYHPTALGILLKENMGVQDRVLDEINFIQDFKFNRVGEDLKPDLIALSNPSEELFDFVYKNSEYPLIVKTGDPTLAEKIGNPGVLLYWTGDTEDQSLARWAKQFGGVALGCPDMETVLKTGEKFRNLNIKNGIFCITSSSRDRVELLTAVRRGALLKKDRNFSFSTLLWIEEEHPPLMAVAEGIMKYAGICVFAPWEPHSLLPLLTLRQNIFTDPRRPIQVNSGIYPFGDVSGDSPLLITTNFSLTYFTVAQEIEVSRVPAYLLVVDTDGTSVLTAWSSDRFNEKIIVSALEKSEIMDKITHQGVIIPGYVANLKEGIEEISRFRVVVGPREASGIPEFLRNFSAKES